MTADRNIFIIHLIKYFLGSAKNSLEIVLITFFPRILLWSMLRLFTFSYALCDFYLITFDIFTIILFYNYI